MHIQNLTLVNFKNYIQAEFTFSKKINCITGDNGMGKTNLLDAIYYLSFCKSYFTGSDSQTIRHGEPFFMAQGTFIRKEKQENIYLGLKRGQKKLIKRNDKPYKKLSEHIGLLPCVIVSPDDAKLVTGGSEERRKFTDIVISQYDKSYLESLIRYNKALAQRNALLKSFAVKNNYDANLLALWDEQLVLYGAKIHEKRQDFTKRLLPVFKKYYDNIAQGKETVSIKYDSQLNKADFKTLIKSASEKDRHLQYTTVGVHRDDFVLKIGEYLLKRIGSQGQQKTFLVSLKLAQLEFIGNINGFAPILLLDDIFDKLDLKRMQRIVQLLNNKTFGQIFITDTNPERVKNILTQQTDDYLIINIDKNTIKV